MSMCFSFSKFSIYTSVEWGPWLQWGGYLNGRSWPFPPSYREKGASLWVVIIWNEAEEVQSPAVVKVRFSDVRNRKGTQHPAFLWDPIQMLCLEGRYLTPQTLGCLRMEAGEAYPLQGHSRLRALLAAHSHAGTSNDSALHFHGRLHFQVLFKAYEREAFNVSGKPCAHFGHVYEVWELVVSLSIRSLPDWVDSPQ